MITMERTKVNQCFYDNFGEHSSIMLATSTEWSNGEGIDVFIQRKNMKDINLSLTYSDISLFRKIFSDFEN